MISYTDSFIFIFTVGVLGLASYFDIKTREVPDFMSYLLIIGGALLTLLSAITSNSISGLEFLPASVGLLFGFSYLMYALGQWAGGDVKLMLGLGFIFTSVDLNSTSSFIALFINILIFGGFYGLIGTIVFGVVRARHLVQKLRYYDGILIALGVAATVLILLYVPQPLSYLLAFEAFLFVSMRYIYLIANDIMFSEVGVDKLTEGDWLAKDIYTQDSKLVVRRRNIGLTKEEIQRLKDHGVRRVLVRIGLPFVPGIFLGVLVTMVFGNPLLTLIPASI